MDRMAAMQAFVRVVDAGSFSAAARQLGVGQPAVSKTIAQLEDRLGVRLLVRSTHGLMPTNAGQHYYDRAREAIAAADEAERAARGAGRGLIGTLRLSAPTTFARMHIIPALGDFMAAHGEVEVEMILDDRIIDLVREGIDVALRMGELADSSATARRIATAMHALVATPAYLAREGEPMVPADLAGHAAIVRTRAASEHWLFTKGGVKAAIELRGRLRVSSAEGVRSAVLADMGLTIASRWMFAPELASGTVRELLPDWRLPTIDLWALYPTGRLASAKARAFTDFIAPRLARAEAASALQENET